MYERLHIYLVTYQTSGIGRLFLAQSKMKFKVLQSILVSIYLVHGFDAQSLLGGVNEVSDSNERQDFANRALDQLEKASNDINARKIVEVIQISTNSIMMTAV